MVTEAKLPPPEIIRKRKVILLTDSGSLIYRGQKKTKPAKFLNNEAEWSNIMAPDIVGGAAWSDWVTYLEKFVTDYSHLMELCPDNVMRFPAHISVIVLDNLNGTNLNDKSQEYKKKEEDRHTLKKFLDDCKKRTRPIGLWDSSTSSGQRCTAKRRRQSTGICPEWLIKLPTTFGERQGRRKSRPLAPASFGPQSRRLEEGPVEHQRWGRDW